MEVMKSHPSTSSPKSPSPFRRGGLFKPFSWKEKGWDEVEQFDRLSLLGQPHDG
jgi:hypothetical protein